MQPTRGEGQEPGEPSAPPVDEAAPEPSSDDETTLISEWPVSGRARLVVGRFVDEASAAEAVHRLGQSGFDARREIAVVSVLVPHGPEVPLAHRVDAWAGVWIRVGVGTLLGAFLGLLVGNGVLPPMGDLVAGGAQQAMFSGALLGALAGALVGGLRWLAVARTSREEVAQREAGAARVGVRTTSEERARTAGLVLREAGATDVQGD